MSCLHKIRFGVHHWIVNEEKRRFLLLVSYGNGIAQKVRHCTEV